MWLPHLKLSCIQSHGMRHSQRACIKKPFVLERTHAKEAHFVTQYSPLWKALSSLHMTLTLELVCILTLEALWSTSDFPFVLNINYLLKSYAINSSFNYYDCEMWYFSYCWYTVRFRFSLRGFLV